MQFVFVDKNNPVNFVQHNHTSAVMVPGSREKDRTAEVSRFIVVQRSKSTQAEEDQEQEVCETMDIL